jgi:hypothetical protein
MRFSLFISTCKKKKKPSWKEITTIHACMRTNTIMKVERHECKREFVINTYEKAKKTEGIL